MTRRMLVLPILLSFVLGGFACGPKNSGGDDPDAGGDNNNQVDAMLSCVITNASVGKSAFGRSERNPLDVAELRFL